MLVSSQSGHRPLRLREPGLRVRATITTCTRRDPNHRRVRCSKTHGTTGGIAAAGYTRIVTVALFKFKIIRLAPMAAQLGQYKLLDNIHIVFIY